MAYLLAQVPWLGIYLGHLGVGGPVRAVVEHCHKEIARRLAKGPSSRDLLFYLVCVSFGLRPTICSWFRGGQNNEDLPSKGPPPRRHLLNDGIVAMGAASETVSGALVSIACSHTPRPTRHFKTRSIGSTLKARIHTPLLNIATCII